MVQHTVIVTSIITLARATEVERKKLPLLSIHLYRLSSLSLTLSISLFFLSPRFSLLYLSFSSDIFSKHQKKKKMVSASSTFSLSCSPSLLILFFFWICKFVNLYVDLCGISMDFLQI